MSLKCFAGSNGCSILQQISKFRHLPVACIKHWGQNLTHPAHHKCPWAPGDECRDRHRAVAQSRSLLDSFIFSRPLHSLNLV